MESKETKQGGKKKLLLIVALLVMVVVGVAGWRYQENQQKAQQQTQALVAVEATKTTDYVTYKGVEGKTALQILKSQHEVSVKTYSFGDLVESIDGVSGTGPKYWTFYVNGKMADVGAGSYQSQSSDKIEWKLEQQ